MPGGRANAQQRSEFHAAAAVAYVLGAKLVRRDRPGTHQTRDFDLIFAGDRGPEPLEVTTFVSRPDLETWERLERLEDGIAAPQLSHDWYLDVGAPITGDRTQVLDVRQIERDVVSILAVLEAAGHRKIEYGPHDPAVAGELRRLAAMGVDGGRATRPIDDDTARVVLVAPVGGFRHPDLVAAGIETEAAKADNQKKLSQPSGARQRHLVVVFDGSAGAAFLAAYHGSRGRLPQLPHPITTAWACAGASLLGATPPHAWEHHRIPRHVFDAPQEWLPH